MGTKGKKMSLCKQIPMKYQKIDRKLNKEQDLICKQHKDII